VRDYIDLNPRVEKRGKKMKKLLFPFLIAVILTSCATMTANDLPTDKAKVAKVISAPDLSKDQLFALANSWAVDSFTSANSVIEYSDKEAGIIKGKYTSGYFEGVYTFSLRSTITIEVKDGASRITISDSYYRATSGLGQSYYNTEYYPMRSAESFEKNCLPKYNELIKSFESAIQKPVATF
jgi:hypothetical protein